MLFTVFPGCEPMWCSPKMSRGWTLRPCRQGSVPSARPAPAPAPATPATPAAKPSGLPRWGQGLQPLNTWHPWCLDKPTWGDWGWKGFTQASVKWILQLNFFSYNHLTDGDSDAALALWMSQVTFCVMRRYPNPIFSKIPFSTWSHTESETHTFWCDRIPTCNPTRK